MGVGRKKLNLVNLLFLKTTQVSPGLFVFPNSLGFLDTQEHFLTEKLQKLLIQKAL